MLTMRPSSAVQRMVWLTVGPDSMSTVRLSPLPPVAFSTCFGPVRVLGADGEIGAELLEPRAARVVGRGADHELRAHQLGDLQADDADAGACALHHHGLAGLEPAGGDQRVVQRVQPDRQGRGLLEAHAVGDFHGAAVVADRDLGVAAGRVAHHPVALLEVAHVGADLDHLAGEFAADRLAGRGAVAGVALGRAEIGAVERDRLDLDQEVGRLRLRLRHVLDDDAVR